MNKEEIKKQFEIAALGCLDNEQFKNFIKAVEEHEELKSEFGKYQKVAALIPFSLKFQQPSVEVKNKVVIGIKKIVLSKMKESKPEVQSAKEKKSEVVHTESIVEEIMENVEEEIVEPTDNIIQNEEEILLDNLDFNEEKIDEEDEESIAENSEVKNDFVQYSETKSEETPEVKVNIDYGPILKEKIVEEVTKKIKKTFSNHFEELENKINKSNKLIKILLFIITLLTLSLVAFNVYQIFYPVEKNVEIKKEIKIPSTESPDSLL